ncbi:MAG: hypothetical protein A3I77_06075 [Gammaproteobacteria bacterium RIFCSPLOWO2_02_FULL_42_14]|nr:MAG: hypothetical protein A3B71_06665 [Gammaproteobacteria bacterium RIFCSPHIGHO2_02_FULL_42_43]OGT28073.1 MAG: hypothetical protein A2624_02650 [Gammaproteobacteria bacterium RIFCSPHIGHO2_01_FULL_42_8]OGT52563.1 MAG: hypothetical protein A3E54_06270 [Gammaproteobacteria bacterium RIFCSPHIGHO2_12_FULL_41_25]OGT63161.1 MAG: hypothetical protein A3I77_06075 [Gammaproteobacteria bacterium RIFCSPLOWO2_02_FULL_42_14]OGT86661.1 MAG: hypothetical protein A3G86_04895 [Gammaproteobacteria bacterium R
MRRNLSSELVAVRHTLSETLKRHQELIASLSKQLQLIQQQLREAQQKNIDTQCELARVKRENALLKKTLASHQAKNDKEARERLYQPVLFKRTPTKKSSSDITQGRPRWRL